MILTEYVKTNKEAFLSKVETISAKLGIKADWLMAVMYKESRINEKALNKNGGATGLIQFMPSTAKGLGTTTSALYNMSNVQQLDYVYKYFQPYKGRIKSYEDLYMITFFPAMLGKSNDTVIKSGNLSAETVAKANAVIDLDKNGEITVGEFKQYALKGLEAFFLP